MAKGPPPERLTRAKESDSQPYSSAVIAIIERELIQLIEWAHVNKLDAKKDKRDFWSLKIPAIIGGFGVSALQAFDYGSAVIILGLITSVCVAIDGVHPRGSLYNVHKKAANELYGLQDKLGGQLSQLRLKYPNLDNDQCRSEASMLLIEIQKEKDRINKYLTSVEASLDVNAHDSNR